MSIKSRLLIKQNEAYWKKREKAEKEWQIKNIKNMNAFNRHLISLYNDALESINNEILSYLHTDKSDYEAIKSAEYERLARQLGEKYNGNQDLTDKAKKALNHRLKLYRVSLPLGRDEALKSMIGLHLADLGAKQDAKINQRLLSAFYAEKKRQAGILGVTVKDDYFRSPAVIGTIYKQTAGADFSDRIWANVDVLKGELDGELATEIIKGENPRTMAKRLRGLVNDSIDNDRYATERIARTETARVQTRAALNLYEQYDIKYVKWWAEAGACRTCLDIYYKDDGYGVGVYKRSDVPTIPVHPNCCCSLSPYIRDE